MHVKFWSDGEEVTCFHQTRQHSRMSGKGEVYFRIFEVALEGQKENYIKVSFGKDPDAGKD